MNANKKTNQERDLVAKELSRATAAVGMSPDVLRLDSHRVTPDMALPPLENLFRFDGTPCFYRGEVTVVAGKAKSGKTCFTSLLMACCLRSGILGLEREQEQPLHVMWYDTEQSVQSTHEILCERIIQMVGDDFPTPLFDVFNVRMESWDQRMALLEKGIGYHRPDLVVVDGVRDLVDDINNGTMAQEINERLLHLASRYQCSIVCVIHQNKTGDDDNLRGWIGTELMNKAFEIWISEKLMPERIFAVKQTRSRKQEVERKLYFTFDDKGMPQPSDGPEESPQAAAPAKKLPPMNRDYIIRHDDDSWEVDVRQLICDTLSDGPMYYTPLQQKAMTLLNCHDSGYWNKVFLQAKLRGIIANAKVNGKSMWMLSTQVPTQQAPQADMFAQAPADEPSPY